MDQGHPYGAAWGPAWTLPPPEPPGRRRRNRSLAAIAAVTAAAVVGAAGVSSARDGRVQDAVSRRLPVLQEFVAAERGLAFLTPVEVEVLDDAAFFDAFYAGDDGSEDTEDVEGAAEADRDATLHGLGQLDDDEDLDELSEDAAQDVVGFYDDTDSRLVVRGTELDAYGELVLVHELTHALQDQYFRLSERYSGPGDERDLAYSALVEGDATRVELAWYDDQPADVQDEIDDAGGPGASGSSPDVVEDTFSFPYYAGLPYVLALLEQNGQASVDAAFEDPPTTTAQVLHPGRPRPAHVADPTAPPGTEVVDRGVLGELGLAQLLERDPLEDGPQSAWAGDRFVTVLEDDSTCTYVDLRIDPAGSADLLEELAEWAEDEDDAQVTGSGDRVGLRSCVS